MKKQAVLAILLSCLLSTTSFAQQIGYSYQTLVSRQSPGLGVDVNETLKDYPVKVRFTLRAGSEDGAIQYQEEHETKTNAFGILNAIVGNGFKQGGSELQSLDWSVQTYYLQVEIDLNDGEGYRLMSSEPILVPPHAKSKDQELTLDGTMLSISGDPGTSVDLEPVIGQEGVNGDELQTLEAGDAPGELSISKKNSVVINVEDADSDPANENQTVSPGTAIMVTKSGQDFQISNTAPDQEVTIKDGGSGNLQVRGSYPDFTIDVPLLEDADSDPTNENQVVSAGNGIQVVQSGQEFTVSNTAPDQEVTLADAGSGNVTIGGSYPDFTIDVDAAGNGSFSTIGNITSNSPGDLSNDDFVFGSPDIENDDNPDHFSKFLFDKSTGSFRAGMAIGNTWDSAFRGIGSIGMGRDAMANGDGSVALGDSPVADKDNAIAIGANARAFGSGAVAIGHHITSYSALENSFGSFNTLEPGSEDLFVLTDKLFVIGNGIDNSNRSDALVMLKNGSTTLNGTLTIDSDNMGGENGYTLPPQDGNVNQVLTTAGDGTTSWQPATGESPFGLNNGVISNKNPDTEDFVFGGSSLDNVAGTDDDNRFFFNKSKGAFRAGSQVGSGWDDFNVGPGSTAFGEDNIASGLNSFSAGHANISSGVYAATLGSNNEVMGWAAFASGRSLRVESFSSVVFGRFNLGGGTPHTWWLDEPLFEIGNGSSETNRSNALTVLKNGNTVLNGTLTIDADNVGGERGYILPSQDGSNGQVMTTDGSGNASWASVGGGFTRRLGQEYLDGIIFYLYIGTDGQEHGLVVHLEEGVSLAWSNSNVLVGVDRSWDGEYNTNLMTDSPAKDYVDGLVGDWYIPGIDELQLLMNARVHVNRALHTGGHTLLSVYPSGSSGQYWSSTESENDTAFIWLLGRFDFSNKSTSASVRAIRSF